MTVESVTIELGQELQNLLNGEIPTKRGPSPEDSFEKFLDMNNPFYFALRDFMTIKANEYAREHLKTVAVNPSPLLLTRYDEGQHMTEHVDQYVRGGASTLNRTVSGSLIIEPSIEGGQLVIQDKNRVTPGCKHHPQTATLLLWPADWWHFVTRVRRGRRRSLVCWWDNGTAEAHVTPDPDPERSPSFCGGLRYAIDDPSDAQPSF